MPNSPSTSSPYTLETAQIQWRDNDLPTSSEYDDIYFSKQQGLAETEYVFLKHNQLAERWQALDKHQPGCFTIAETGFGTGLNFLAAWQLWQQHAPANWQLHFITVEKHPLRKVDLQRALAAWPQLSELSAQLINNYPALVPGHHPISFTQQKAPVHLQLLLGEACEGFEQCLATPNPQWAQQAGAKVDAWFLDGFAPSKNPSMWSDDLFKLIAQLSKTGTTAATFTAAGIVRRGLREHGFSIKKVPGFGRKREMVTAVFDNNAQAVSNEAGENPPAPRFSRSQQSGQTPWHIFSPTDRPKHVAIIGGGIAGCSSAYALAKRGIQVTLLERHAKLAQEASGNAQGMLYTKLSPLAGKLNQFTLNSYFYALRFYQQLRNDGLLAASDVDFCGLLQLIEGNKQEQHLNELKQAFAQHDDWVQFIDAQQASTLSGIECPAPAYFLSGSGWLSPTALCQGLVQHPLINVQYQNDALSLERKPDGWQIKPASSTTITADAVIIANNHDALNFSQTAQLPLKVIRGQVTELDENAFTSSPKTVICHDGYLTPAIDGHIRFGATFGIGDNDKQTRLSDHQLNIESLQGSLPSFLKQSTSKLLNGPLSGRANLRCSSPDYLPLVGPSPITEAFVNDYAILRKDANRVINTTGSYHAGLFINAGHGSRGLTSTPLCSELLAAQICNEPLPLGRDFVISLNPARFLIKDIIRGKIKSAC